MNTQQEILRKFSKNIEKDFFYNKEKFLNGDTNILYITGFSGSGKTTLSRLAKEVKNVEVVEHDNLDLIICFTAADMRKSGNILCEFYDKHDEFYKEYKTEEEKLAHYKAFNDFILDYAKRNPDKVIIVEGTRSLNAGFSKDIAIIIKHTSMIKSFYRALKRNSVIKGVFGERETNIFYIIKRFFECLFSIRRWKYYNTTRKNLKKIKKLALKRVFKI